MAKKEDVKENEKRRTMTIEDVEFMIDNWDKMTLKDLADKFGVKESTLGAKAAFIRKKSGGKLCPINRVKFEDQVDKLLATKYKISK